MYRLGYYKPMPVLRVILLLAVYSVQTDKINTTTQHHIPL